MITIRSLVTTLLACAALAAPLVAKPLAGPKGGRILTTEAPHAEFFVAKDRTVVVAFYGSSLEPVPVAGRVVNAIAETKAGKARLEFVERDGALVSTAPLPAGDDYTVVVQIKDNAAARPKNYRVVFHDEVCGECKRAEYACICEDHGQDHGHAHEKKKA